MIIRFEKNHVNLIFLDDNLARLQMGIRQLARDANIVEASMKSVLCTKKVPEEE